jgi:phosphatidylinositol alpha-1,6-mannosyltransferase
MAARWQVSDRLTIISDVGDDELPQMYAAADIFAMTSRRGPEGEVDGFGIVYLEAAASALACIAGSLGGCRDAVADGVTGWCVDPTDPEAVAVALKSVLDDVDTSTRMGERGRERVLSSFTKARAGSLVVEMLEACASTHDSRGRSVGS